MPTTICKMTIIAIIAGKILLCQVAGAIIILLPKRNCNISKKKTIRPEAKTMFFIDYFLE